MKTIPKLILNLIIPTVLLVCYTYSCKAQIADTIYYKHGRTYYWIEADAAYTSLGNTIGGSANILRNNLILQLKATHNLSSDYLQQAPQEYAVTAGLKLTHNKFSNFIFSSGFSIAKIRNTAGYDTYYGLIAYNTPEPIHYYTGYGMPFEIKYLNNAGFAGTAGISGAASLHINSRTDFASFTIGIALGRLREAGR